MREIWINDIGQGSAHMFSINVRSPLIDTQLDRVMVFERELPHPKAGKNFDKCTDDEKVVAQNFTGFSQDDLLDIYFLIQKALDSL